MTLAMRVFGRPAGVIGAFLVALHLGLIVYSGLRLHPLPVGISPLTAFNSTS